MFLKMGNTFSENLNTCIYSIHSERYIKSKTINIFAYRFFSKYSNSLYIVFKVYMSVVGFRMLKNFLILLILTEKKTVWLRFFLRSNLRFKVEKSLPVLTLPSDGRMVTTILFSGPRCQKQNLVARDRSCFLYICFIFL